jgi:hypothetical protein
MMESQVCLILKWKLIPCSQIVTPSKSLQPILFMSSIYLVSFEFGPAKWCECMTAGNQENPNPF